MQKKVVTAFNKILWYCEKGGKGFAAFTSLFLSVPLERSSLERVSGETLLRFHGIIMERTDGNSLRQNSLEDVRM